MTDRVYPAKPAAPYGYGAAVGHNNSTFPATKSQIHGASTRPLYRPQPTRRHRRSCCCSFCICFTITIILLILHAAIAGAIIYALYLPRSPTFSVSSLKISTLNLTSSSAISSNLKLNISAKNPNSKLVYLYNAFTVSITTADGINVGDGSLPAFVHPTKNTTLLKLAISSPVPTEQLDDSVASQLKTDLKSKNGVPLKINLDTKVKAELWDLKTPKVGIRVSCEGIRATVPTGKTATTASVSNARCKVDMRIKIWKWTF